MMLAKHYIDEQESLIGQQLDELQKHLRTDDSEVPMKTSPRGNYGCSNDIPPLERTECGEAAKYQMYSMELDHLLAHTNPAMLAEAGAFLVCDSDEEAAYMRLLLDRRNLGHIEARVKQKWTPEMAAAKAAYARAQDALGQRVRHHAQFTKSQPSAKARKAARKRAKAGRRAAR